MAVDLLLDIYDAVTVPVVPFLLGYLPFNVNHIVCAHHEFVSIWV
jgi:hypothetical protein